MGWTFWRLKQQRHSKNQFKGTNQEAEALRSNSLGSVSKYLYVCLFCPPALPITPTVAHYLAPQQGNLTSEYKQY